MIGKMERRRALRAFAQGAPAADGPGGAHAIEEVRAFAAPAPGTGSVGTGSAYVVLQVRTRSGLTGYGECKTLSSAELKTTRDVALGRPASAYERLRPLVPPAAQAAVDMALLDILGKATKAPVYRVLGGPTRTKARAIVRLMGSSDDELQKDLQRQLAAGFTAFLIPIPPPAARNQGSAYVHTAVELFRAMRAAAANADFAFECSDQLTPSDTATLAAAVESMHPLWFDAPCPVSNLATLHKIADETVVPLGFGRDISNPGTYQDLLREGLVDLLRPNLLTHGISGTRRLAAMAETYYVAVSPWHDAGPIATAAALHLAASIPNFFIVQLPTTGAGSATPRDGFFDLPKGPGLGVDVDGEGTGEDPDPMNRRSFIGGAAALAAAATPIAAAVSNSPSTDLCGCDPLLAQAMAGRTPVDAFRDINSGLRVTGMKVFGVSLTPDSDRPYVFVKLETNQGLVGWGEGTLEGKAKAAMSCIEDFRDFVVGKDPMQVEHHWQSMYVHSFYRAGPVIGSAISGIDQALWDLRGKALNVPVYQLLGGPYDADGVRGYYHAENARSDEDLAKLRETALQEGVSCFKIGLPDQDYEWIETHAKIDRAIKHMQRIREKLGDSIDIAVDFHAKTSPSVASIIVKEVEPLHLLFIEEPCPPENVQAMGRVARRSTTPIATGERLVAAYGCRELIEMGIVDILQTDINHVGGVTGLWKVAAMANISNVSMAPHACEGPIGGLATLHVDSSMPNFLIQEICSFVQPGDKERIWAEWFGFPPMRMVNGRFPLPTKPGLGFELSEASLSKYPFGGSKPMARVFHPDGSVGEW